MGTRSELCGRDNFFNNDEMGCCERYELPKIRDVQVHAIDNLLNKDSVVL